MPTLTPGQLITVARRAGFSSTKKTAGIPQDVLAVAVALAESGGDTHAHNSTPPDNSYGPWQINMYGDLGPDRRKTFGLKRNEDLFNPDKNAQAAYAISSNGTNFTPWSVYTNGKYITKLPAAKRAAGDPEDVDENIVGGGAAAGGLGDLTDFLQGFGLRAAMLVGGTVLLILGVVAYLARTDAAKALSAIPGGGKAVNVAKAVT